MIAGMADPAATDDEPRPDADSEASAKLHKTAMRHFDEAVLLQIPVREVALIARRIAAIPGAIWDGSFGDQFDNVIKLDAHKLDKAIRKAETDYRQNRIVPDFRPAGGDSDNDTASTLNGMHRADSYYFKSQQARDNAFSECAKGGFGAYRLVTDWADPLDKQNDHQRVNPASLIADADQSVFFGPSALYDKSDAPHAFVLVTMSPEAFKEEYPDAAHTEWLQGVPAVAYSWYRSDSITVAEYYVIEETDEWLLIFEQKRSGEQERHWQKDVDAADIKALTDRGFTQRKRKATKRHCRKWVLSGREVLAGPIEIAGGNIPIVPVYCNRNYIDGVEWFTGLLTSSKIDSAKLYVSMVSRLAEVQALSPNEKPILTPEQVQGHEQSWARGNIDRVPYQLINPQLDPITGGIATLAPVGTVTPSSVPQSLAALLEIANRDMTEDDNDGAEQVRANTSADAMDMAAARVDAKTGVLLDNNRQSTQREGELYLSMARVVYAEPDREVETMTEDGDDGVAKLHADKSDSGDLIVINNFATGKYKVMASVTEATATRRDRTVKQMLTMSELSAKAGDQEGSQAALITAGLNMDGEGLGDFQAWNRKRALRLGLVEPNEDEKKAAAQEAETAQQQPDPQAQIMQAQLQKLAADAQKAMADAGLSQAKVQEVMASAGLKMAQAQTLGGPEQAPDVPSGLQAANDQADNVKKLADADHATAQAAKIRAELPMQRLRFGHEIEAHEASMSERAV